MLARTLGIRRLAREWSGDLEQNRFLHVRMQLEVAALAQAQGAQVEFETKLPGFSRPTDVVITAGSDRLVAECFSIYQDLASAEALAYDRDFGLQLHMRTLDVRLSGHWDVRLPPVQTAELLAEVENVAAQVSADGVERTVTRPGIEFRIVPWSAPMGSEVTVEGPTTPAAGWRRAGGIISDKAQKWGDAPLPAWLRFDLLDGTALFSDWAQRPLAGKSEWMAALVAEAVGSANIAGVVVSCGACLDARATAQDYTGAGGIVGLRRRVDPLRIRESFVVPLSPIGAPHALLWRDLYDGESQWLTNALHAAALPDMDAINSGWTPLGS